MKCVAVLGASGFIGTRIVEMFHLGGNIEIRPIVRARSRLAGLSRFELDQYIAEAFDKRALSAALSGCDAAIYAMAGSPSFIVNSVRPVYESAQLAGVRRLIYLSSGAVHGQSPRPGVTEDSPLDEKQPLPYNNAKVRAEAGLRRLRERGTVEVVILRPSIVFGPRSSWVARFAEALLDGQTCFTGNGICNSIYVDNLVHAISLAIEKQGVDGQAFLLGDAELVRWSDFHGFIAGALGFDLSALQIEAVATHEREPILQKLRRSRPVKASIALCPAKLRLAISAGLAALKSKSNTVPRRTQTQSTLEVKLLHACEYKLPHDKAARLLGYDPIVSFAEGCRRTVGWMAFAGYPVQHISGNLTTPQVAADALSAARKR
jgi:nucleoside-diphosphate-sugar epimerase